MNTQQIATAQKAVAASHDGSMAFPHIVGTLIEAGFEAYTVDYRRNRSTYYLPDGDSVDIDLHPVDDIVAAAFDASTVEAAVREAQTQAPGYTYAGFCRKVRAAGCAGYMVSFSGRHVVYFGRTAEVHVEYFPQ
ncbi:DUF1398 family protein [Asticcacaulis excentricus]|uniref:Phage envelope protein n=1 Tax=Asticcacaulis excentricus (strain ATCC 15261 / DSM 4724 / KCTC 12464 / NCIMB 9791 / VKM B-1370 / CB 48) TaxID=573065 RepID=E8RQQ2_ASTEC|nr:DUF1398 family protein [Asticcacaulis excentricus]ADU13280.1 hypothetical protein Astex_1614 [Asticcacaulis excentricus CB 48]